MLVSTQHTGDNAQSTLTRGGSKLAEGGDMQRGCSGNYLGHTGARGGQGRRWCRPTSHRLPPCSLLGSASPSWGQPHSKEGQLEALGPWMGQLSQAPAPMAGPLAHTVTQGSGGMGCLPRACPSLMGASVISPRWLSSEPIPPLTQPWKVFSPPTGPPKGLILAISPN